MMSDERLLAFCRALSGAVRSGLPLGETLETLAQSAAHGREIVGVARLTARGSSLHEALSAQKVFPKVLVVLVRAGEESGKVDEFLDRFADCLEVRIELRRRIKRALVYPAFTAILTGAVFLFLVFKAIPLVLEPLLSAGIMSDQVLWLQRFSELFYERWPRALACLLVAGIALRVVSRSRPGRTIGALAGHWLPGFGFATQHARLYHISTIMGLLVKAGIPFGTMSDVLAQFFRDDPIISRRLSRASTMLTQGRGFSESIGDCIPLEDRRGLEIAERTGRLDEALLRLGKTHYDAHWHRMKLLGTYFKIAMTLVLAPMLLVVLLALILPVMSVLGKTKEFLAEQHPVVSPVVFSQERSPNDIKMQGLNPSDFSDAAQRPAFNESRARGIVDFMRQHPLRRQDDSPAQGPKKLKLGPIPKIRTVQPRKIQPTPVQATDFGK